MSAAQTGEKNGAWKGGRVVDPRGYVLLRVGKDHPHADVRGYAYEHRLIAEAAIGRALTSNEVVHHIDGNKSNNAPENLQVVTATEHCFEHRSSTSRDRLRKPGQPNQSVACACGCGTTFDRFDKAGRPRRFVSGHNVRIRAGAVA